MHRCFVDPDSWAGDTLHISREEEHHLLDVLRANVGDEVTAFDGRGREARTIIIPLKQEPSTKSRERVALQVVSTAPASTPAVRIILLQAIPKGTHMDLIVEKATELGVSQIVPVVTSHTIVRLDAEKRRERATRWQKIALSAAKQCQTCWTPEVSDVLDLEAALAGLEQVDLFLVGSLGPEARSFKAVLEEARAIKISSVALLIGPEGDLTAAEREAAYSRGAKGVSFGRLIMRVETAAIFGLSVLANELLTTPRDEGASLEHP